ncbi:hypothetical protein JW979_09280 [bacterium]|nr:hypothetical protein [candidate division CSSED10-310 bacterium]
MGFRMGTVKTIKSHEPNIRKGWHYLKFGILGFAGFVLSPCSWWNDLYINIPLAWWMTWLPLKFCSSHFAISKSLWISGMVVNYWITNVAGMIIMHYSGKKLINKDAKIDLIKDLAVALLFTILMSVFLYLNPGEIFTTLNVIPDWIH